MIERFNQTYDGSVFFISDNEKKIAADNVKAVKDTPFLILLGSIIYIFMLWSFKLSTQSCIIFILPIVVIPISYFVYKKYIPFMMQNLYRVRIFSLTYYSLLFLSLGTVEAYRHPSRMVVIVPIGIFIISAVYVDYFLIMLIYKVGLGLIFLLIDYRIKNDPSITEDISILLLSIIISSFCYYIVMRNITDRSLYLKELEKSNKTDILTGLLNKSSFEEKSRDYLTRRKMGAKATMFKMNLDDFKHINDKYGHHIGDEVLRRFGCILRDYFHPTDAVGRVDGDEFMVLVMGEMPESFIEKRCRSIQQDLKTYKIGEATGFSCSIGVCEDCNGHTYEEMSAVADDALTEAKSSGKACHVVMHG